MEKVELNLMETPDRPIIILEGKANTPREPLILNKVGNIESVRRFLAKRYTDGTSGIDQQHVIAEAAFVYADDEELTITLYTNPNDPFGTIIKGKLEHSVELKKWKINVAHKWNRKDLVKFLRMNRRFFTDGDAATAFMQAYGTMKIEKLVEMEQSSDTRGNKEEVLRNTVKADGIPTSFEITLPLFKGQPKETIKVEVDLEVSDNTVLFEFVSPGLVDLIEDKRGEIFVKELQCCADFPIIYK